MTKEQKSAVYEETATIISDILGDMFDGGAVAENIGEEVITDIEETADWSDFADDEYCLDDIIIAVRRVIYNHLIG